MLFTNIKESGFESLIVDWLVNQNGYELGTSAEFNKANAIDENRLLRFLRDTQPEKVKQLGILRNEKKKSQFLDRLQGEITKRGIIDVLRNGIHIVPADLVTLYFLTPSEGNKKARELYEKNIFSVTRQLHYSFDETRLSLDLCLFINGLPVITFELKNSLTKQNTDDAVLQYQTERNPHEPLFAFKRCAVHFAVDDQRVKFCTKLDGANSLFLPFDKGYRDGAGNPPNPDGLKTDYLWKEILRKDTLSRILENYAQVVEIRDEETKKVSVRQIWPRYHQFDVVEKLLDDVRRNGVGKRYLIQHSAGSGKSNSITWLANLLIEIQKANRPVFNSVLVVTDRRILDKQIRDNIRRFTQVPSTVVWAEHSADLRNAITNGKRIIVTTIEKFPFIVDQLGTAHKGNRFGIIIDEAHSSQNGKTASKMNLALSGEFEEGLEDEDKINQLVESRKMLKNASYFAFTATPKNKTLEVFGVPFMDGDETKHRPFHVYTMKQAIQEGFILDVLQNYTTYQSAYQLKKKIEEDPEFDKKKALKKMRAFAENHPVTIAKKAEIIVEHFHSNVATLKIGGQARAMVVTNSIDHCLEYFTAINQHLAARKSPYKAIIAYSGTREYEGEKEVTCEKINGFTLKELPGKFKKEPYRILVVADMYQTGFDEPLLHTMYVDKQLADIAAVQTLSRLNRSCPKKYDTFVLDFANDTDTIEAAFSRYYRTTILANETDPNKLYDLITVMEGKHVYAREDVELVVEYVLKEAPRYRMDPILDRCANEYNELDTDSQIEFKSAAKSFVRTYNFLGSILPIGMPQWEKLTIFLSLLIPKLPAPPEEDFTKELLESIDLDTLRVISRSSGTLTPIDADAEVDAIPVESGGGKPEPEMEFLSRILSDFNTIFGNIEWKDSDAVIHHIARIKVRVGENEKFQNAVKFSDSQNARKESDAATSSAIQDVMADSFELFKQFQDNKLFRRWLEEIIFKANYHKAG